MFAEFENSNFSFQILDFLGVIHGLFVVDFYRNLFSFDLGIGRKYSCERPFSDLFFKVVFLQDIFLFLTLGLILNGRLQFLTTIFLPHKSSKRRRVLLFFNLPEISFSL